MNKMIINILKNLMILAIAILFGGSVQAQVQKFDAQIKVLTKYDGKVVKLRWAPEEAYAWKLLNKTGYIVERYTVILSGTPVTGKPIMKLLTPTPLKPWDKDDVRWASLAQDNDNVAIAYQTVHDKVQATFGGSSNITAITDQNSSNQNAFAFALYAADIDPKAAEALGISFVDSEVKANSQYTYVIRSAETDDVYTIEEGVKSVRTFKKAVSPNIETVKVVAGDQIMKIAVYVAFLKAHYTAYYIEKKENEQADFVKLDRPMQVHLDPKGKPTQWMEIVDSLAHNNVTYQYRIQGIDAFGDKGPFSEVIKVQGKDLFDGMYSPIIDTLINEEQKSVRVDWSFDQAPIAKKLEILKAANIEGPYEVLQTIADPATKGNYIDNTPSGTNYYKVAAYDIAGRKAESHPRFMQLEDNTPPTVPDSLAGDISEEGLVSIHWQANTEKDLYGYRVFTSNTPKGTWVEVTKDVIEENNFAYPIPIDNLTPDIYYKVIAMDLRYNQSPYSTVLHLKKPDKIAPVPPVISKYVVSVEGVQLSLHPSPSSDIKSYRLLTKNMTSGKTDTVAYWNTKSFPEKYALTLTKGAKVTVQLMAIDHSGNDALSDVLFFELPKSTIIKKYDGLQFIQSAKNKRIQLNWKKLREKVTLQSWQVYKSENGGDWHLYKILEADKSELNDYFVRVTNGYKYRIKINDPEGEFLGWSNEVKIDF